MHRPEQHVALLTISLVSHLWRVVAEGTPQLWTLLAATSSLRATPIPTKRLIRLSRNIPLHIDIQLDCRGVEDTNPCWAVINQLLGIGSRWKTLQIKTFFGPNLANMRLLIPSELPILTEAHLDGQLCITNDDDDFCWDAFACSPKLRRLTCGEDTRNIPFLHFSALRRLTLYDPEDADWSDIWSNRLALASQACPTLELLEVVQSPGPTRVFGLDYEPPTAMECRFSQLKMVNFSNCQITTTAHVLAHLASSVVTDVYLHGCVAQLTAAGASTPWITLPKNSRVEWSFRHFETFCNILAYVVNPEEVTWRIDSRKSTLMSEGHKGAFESGQAVHHTADLRSHWDSICDRAARMEWILPDGSEFRVGGRDALEILIAAAKNASC